jgi:hypothetical protein
MIASADSRRGAVLPVSHLHADESGFMSITHLVCVMFFALLSVWLLNIGKQTTDAPNRQGAADAAAAGAALWVEHGLNELTALNHAMGEAASFVALHEALVGPLPPRGSPEDLVADARLAAAVAYRTSQYLPCPAYKTVGQPIRVRGAIGRAKRRLKERLADLYFEIPSTRIGENGESNGGGIEDPGPELKLEQEFLWLTQLEVKTLALSAEVTNLERVRLPRLDRQARTLVIDTPQVAAAAAESLAARYNLQGGVVPFELPVQRDPLARSGGGSRVSSALYADWSPLKSEPVTLSADDRVAHTQLARAAWPWLVYHRVPIRDNLRRKVPLSDAAKFLNGELRPALIGTCRRLQQRDVALYMLRESTPLGKGHERWGTKPVHADRVFAVVGWATSEPGLLEGEPAVFRNSHPQGRLSLAQALAYSALPQEPNRSGLGSRQPRVGWDTLAWNNRAGNEPHEVSRRPPENPPFPKIAVNWQSTLVPVSPQGLRKTREAGSLPGGVAAILGRLDPQLPRPLQTH